VPRSDIIIIIIIIMFNTSIALFTFTYDQSYIIQSPHQTQVFTDSTPCVQVYEKLKRGEFSASSRVTTFLSTVSRYSIHVRHIAGVENLPSDFAGRNPNECLDSSCQICKFIVEFEESVVRSISVDEVLDRRVNQDALH